MTNEWHSSHQSQMAGLAAVCGMNQGICAQGRLRRRMKSHEAIRGQIQTPTSVHTGTGSGIQSPMKRSVITALLSQDHTQMTGLLFQHRTGWPGIVYFSVFHCPEYSKDKHAIHIERQSLLMCVQHNNQNIKRWFLLGGGLVPTLPRITDKVPIQLLTFIGRAGLSTAGTLIGHKGRKV